jgi:DNA-binding SARP family transcriptional activator/tetratricopeptide (TPR) repeat protein
MVDTATANQTGATVDVMFRILGPLEVGAVKRPVRIPSGRQEVILAALLLDANRMVSTDHLVDLIWDEEPPDTARTQVQICVSRLRKVLARAGVDAAIISRPPGYLLQIAPGALDLSVFGRQVAQARVLVKEGRVAEAAELLRTASRLWRGPCMSGIPNEALRIKALRLDEDRLNAIETYLDLELGLGRHHQLVGEIGSLMREHPLRERLRGQYMLALYRAGRQAEALEAYQAGRALLIEELGLEPGEELHLLEEAILSGDPLLRVDSEQLGGPPAARQENPGASYRPGVPRQLPATTADFVGGAKLVQAVQAALSDMQERSATGVVVIVGRPGIGKSAAATYIAHRLSTEYFPDGQLYCDLRGTGPEPLAAREVLGRFLRALGIPGPMIPEPLDERAEMYRTILATRRVLIVLDDASTERQIGPLLPGSGSCTVLVTSRARLTGLPGCRRIELDVLTVDQALELCGRIIGDERVAREPDAARALVRTVGGLPLAVRIVAARLAARPHWTLASMVRRLANERHRLDELAHGEMTVRASLSLTHDGLGATERRLFRLLSLAQGPTLPAWLAGALLDDHRAQPSDLLELLVDVQMLDVVVVEATVGLRYRFHEIIRVFAREQLEIGEEAAGQRAAVERTVGGWLAILEQAHRKIYGGDYTVLRGTASRWHPPAAHVQELLGDPLEWMDAESVNLCCAVDQAAAAQLDEHCWELATALVTLFEARGYLDLWERTHRQALEAVRRAGNKRGTAALLSSLGTLHLSRRQPEESRQALDAALGLFEELDDAHGRALCLRDLGLLERRHGESPESALALYKRSIRDFDRAGDIVGKATVLTQSAHVWMRQGDTVTAHARLEEALEIYRSVGYFGGQARALRRMGQVLLQRGEPEAAERKLTEVLAMVRQVGDVIGESHLLVDLGEVNASIGRYEQAERLYSAALGIREQIMDLGGAASVRLDLARMSARLGGRVRGGAVPEGAVRVPLERGPRSGSRDDGGLRGELTAG